ncbi:MAG: PAS domain S-box protein [Chloroflexota bacterium]|nr:PAS domain S-box protein [Chloroflexota bacterium]
MHTVAASQDVTGRREVGQAIVGEKQIINTLLDNSPDAISIKDQHGCYIKVNKAFARRLGLARAQDACGLTAADFYPPDRARSIHDEEQEVIRTTLPVIDKEVRETLPGGEERWICTTTMPMHTTEGKVVGTLSVSRDITERKKTEERLSESEALYRNLVETSPDAISLCDLDCTLLLCNRQCAAMYGYDSSDEVLGQNVFDFIAQEDQAWVRQKMRRLLRTESYHGLEYQMVRRDGTRFTVEMSVSLVKNSAGRPKGVLIVARDITERKCAEKAAASERYQLNLLLESLPDSIYVKDRESKFTRINRALANSLQLADPRDAVGKSDADFFSKELAEASYNDEQEIIRTGVPIFGQEEREVWPDGSETWFLTKKMPLRDEDGSITGTFGMSSDITARKNIDRMKNEFVSMVSHELRTPLTSIRGSLGLIAGGVAGEVSPQVKAMVDIAHSNSERLVRLINDILDMEKIESGKMVFEIAPTSLMPLVSQAMDANQGYAGQFGVRFTIKESLDDATVNIDSDRMIQVLTNLLSNAAKFSPRGDAVEISVVRHDGKIRLLVEDHGPGISEEFSSRIFQKFAQADSSDTRQKGGTGLGLSISKAIVESFGGELSFTTTLGKGTTFYFDLPEWHTYTRDTSALEAGRADRQPHILICEDDRDVANLLGIMLSKGGFTCDTANSAAEAREKLEKESYDAMTLDLMLPDKDGLSLIRELREAAATHNLPIVVVSARAELAARELDAGAAAIIDWVDKPIDGDRLLMSVRRATHQSDARPRILHVEDDLDIVQVVAMMLRDLGEVSHASTLAEAYTKLAEEQFDLVILDLGLPDGRGLELLPRLHQTGPLTSVVLFSAREVSAEEAGNVDAALVKTRASNEKLLSTITELINRNRGMQRV